MSDAEMSRMRWIDSAVATAAGALATQALGIWVGLSVAIVCALIALMWHHLAKRDERIAIRGR